MVETQPVLLPVRVAVYWPRIVVPYSTVAVPLAAVPLLGTIRVTEPEDGFSSVLKSSFVVSVTVQVGVTLHAAQTGEIVAA